MLSELLNNNGYAFITFDFHGHGYSDGIKGLVQDYSHLVDDSLSVILAVYNFDNISSNINRIHNTPFFLMGHSMGGGISIILSRLFTNSNISNTSNVYDIYNNNKEYIYNRIIPLYKGTVLLCPLIYINIPSILKYIIKPLSYLFPLYSLSKYIYDENIYNNIVWSDTEYRNYIENDGYPNNKMGLSYGSNIRFRTLLSMIDISDIVNKYINDINGLTFNMLILHDYKKDVIIPVTGSISLINKSISDDKMLINIDNGLHDILANKYKESSFVIIEWLNRILK